jgi:hypothetical protein
MNVRLEVLQSNRLIRTHVYQKGDVIELDERIAKDWIRLGHAAITTKPVTPIPVSGPRYLQVREREQAALDPGPASAERQTSKGRPLAKTA